MTQKRISLPYVLNLQILLSGIPQKQLIGDIKHNKSFADVGISPMRGIGHRLFNGI